MIDTTVNNYIAVQEQWKILEIAITMCLHCQEHCNCSCSSHVIKITCYTHLGRLRRCYTRQLATCLAILLRYKLHEILPSVTYLLLTFVAFFLLPQSLRKVEVSSTFRNAFRNIARNFSHVAQCNTFPATCVATFNDIGESNCSFCAREVLFQDIMAAELTTASKIT